MQTESTSVPLNGRVAFGYGHADMVEGAHHLAGQHQPMCENADVWVEDSPVAVVPWLQLQLWRGLFEGFWLHCPLAVGRVI